VLVCVWFVLRSLCLLCFYCFTWRLIFLYVDVGRWCLSFFLFVVDPTVGAVPPQNQNPHWKYYNPTTAAAQWKWPPPTMEVLSNQTTPHWKYTTLFVEIWKSVWTSVDRSRYTTFNTYNIRMLPKSIWEIRTGEHTKHSTTFLLLQIVKMNPHIINRRYSALHMVTAMSKTKIPI